MLSICSRWSARRRHHHYCRRLLGGFRRMVYMAVQAQMSLAQEEPRGWSRSAMPVLLSRTSRRPNLATADTTRGAHRHAIRLIRYSRLGHPADFHALPRL